MTAFEKDVQVDQIVEQYKNYEIDRELAERDLRLLGCTESEIKMALGQVLLNG
jgi:hypothetical protein